MDKTWKKDREKFSSIIEKFNSFRENFLLKHDIKELKLLSEWWKNLGDQQQCEILEIFQECTKIKKDLGKSESKKINEVLEISLDKFITAFKNSQQFPKLKEIIGRNKFINLPQIWG